MKKKERRIGADGGNATKKKYGKEWYSLIAKLKHKTITMREFNTLKGQIKKQK